MSVWHLASIIGKFLSYLIICPFGLVHYHYLEWLKLKAQNSIVGDGQQHVCYHEEHTMTLWWQDYLLNTSASICCKSLGSIIFMDGVVASITSLKMVSMKKNWVLTQKKHWFTVFYQWTEKQICFYCVGLHYSNFFVEKMGFLSADIHSMWCLCVRNDHFIKIINQVA